MYLVLGDLGIAIILFCISLIFSNSKGGACKFLSGYNLASEEERQQYDEALICKYVGKQIRMWSLFFLFGAMIDCFFPHKGFIIGTILFMFGLVYHIYVRTVKFDKMFKK